MRINKYLFGLLGVLSGLVSSRYWDRDLIDSGSLLDLFTDINAALPGLIFGVLISLYFIISNFSIRRLLWLLPFTLISSVAFTLSILISIYSMIGLFFLNFAAGGGLGAAILVTAIGKFFTNISSKDRISLIIAGSVLGVSLYIPPQTFDTPNAVAYPLFLIWQGGMAFLIAHFLSRKTKEIPESNFDTLQTTPTLNSALHQ